MSEIGIKKMAATFTGGHHKKINSKLMNTKIIQIKRNLTALLCLTE